MNANDRKFPLILVAGKQTDEVIRRFKNLPDCRVVFTEKMEDMNSQSPGLRS